MKRWLKARWFDALDFCRYIYEEVRNPDRDMGWEEEPIHEMALAQEGTREEQELKRERRNFWDRLMKE